MTRKEFDFLFRGEGGTSVLPNLPAVSMPAALWKATQDTYHYAMQLRTGVVLIFAWAEISSDGEWIHLGDVQSSTIPLPKDEFFSFGRGIDVRLSDVVWVADCES